jgi:hypothetical protein
MRNEDEFSINFEMPLSCFYRVSESIVGIDKDPSKVKSFHWDEDFKGPNLMQDREKALAYYGNRMLKFNMQGINKSFFDKSYANPDDFIPGKNYAYSLDLQIVAVYDKNDIHEYFLLGGDEIDIEEGKEFELKYYKELAYNEEQLQSLTDELFFEEMLIEHGTKFFIVETYQNPNSEFFKLPFKEFLIECAEHLFLHSETPKKYVLKRAANLE